MLSPPSLSTAIGEGLLGPPPAPWKVLRGFKALLFLTGTSLLAFEGLSVFLMGNSNIFYLGSLIAAGLAFFD